MWPNSNTVFLVYPPNIILYYTYSFAWHWAAHQLLLFWFTLSDNPHISIECFSVIVEVMGKFQFNVCQLVFDYHSTYLKKVMEMISFTLHICITCNRHIHFLLTLVGKIEDTTHTHTHTHPHQIICSARIITLCFYAS